MNDSIVSAPRDCEEHFPMLNIPVVGGFVKCKVGPDENLYLVQKDLLISRCPKFSRPALESQFCEAQTNTLILPEEDPKVFELFIHWVHQDVIPPLIAPDESEVMEDWALAEEAKYHGLYYLADKWLINALKNRAIDCIRAYHAATASEIHPSLIEDCFRCTLPTSLLRRYVVESTAFVIKSSGGDEYIERLHEYMEQLQENISLTDFLFDLLKKLSNLIDIGSFDNPNLKAADCDYHEATQGGQCCVVANDFRGDKRLKGHFHKVFVVDEDLEED
ncbi:hypothetical protein MMC27_003969 [Xylographa pallens]|nr:hypothetical protein [Xylographa pallens]